MGSEPTRLPNGLLLHRWTNPTGDEWACVAADHGPFCRLCQPVNGTLAACLENVMDGLFEIVGVEPDGDFRFRVTPEANTTRRTSLTSTYATWSSAARRYAAGNAHNPRRDAAPPGRGRDGLEVR